MSLMMHMTMGWRFCKECDSQIDLSMNDLAGAEDERYFCPKCNKQVETKLEEDEK